MQIGLFRSTTHLSHKNEKQARKSLEFQTNYVKHSQTSS